MYSFLVQQSNILNLQKSELPWIQKTNSDGQKAQWLSRPAFVLGEGVGPLPSSSLGADYWVYLVTQFFLFLIFIINIFSFSIFKFFLSLNFEKLKLAIQIQNWNLLDKRWV